MVHEMSKGDIFSEYKGVAEIGAVYHTPDRAH